MRKNTLVALLPGFLAIDTDAAPNTEITFEPSETNLIYAPLNISTPIYLAGHRSHSSHRSHRSSSGGRYRSPSSSTYTPRSSPLSRPKTPKTTSPPETSASTPSKDPSFYESREIVVKKVQAMLMVHGYYQGSIDGILGPVTRSAILKYRINNNLPGASKIDAALLNSLGILAQ